MMRQDSTVTTNPLSPWEAKTEGSLNSKPAWSNQCSTAKAEYSYLASKIEIGDI